MSALNLMLFIFIFGKTIGKRFQKYLFHEIFLGKRFVFFKSFLSKIKRSIAKMLMDSYFKASWGYRNDH